VNEETRAHWGLSHQERKKIQKFVDPIQLRNVPSSLFCVMMEVVKAEKWMAKRINYSLP
jgi:hypothetical protein